MLSFWWHLEEPTSAGEESTSAGDDSSLYESASETSEADGHIDLTSEPEDKE